MKLYERQIKPYIKPPCLQGCNDSPYPVDGYNWVSEDLEEQLRNEIVVSDSWSTLIFKERYISKGVFDKWEGTPLTVETIQNILNRYFDIPNDTYAYHLTRVKEAFAIGTMSLDDFEEFDEDTTRDLAEYLIEKLND